MVEPALFPGLKAGDPLSPGAWGLQDAEPPREEVAAVINSLNDFMRKYHVSGDDALRLARDITLNTYSRKGVLLFDHRLGQAAEVDQKTFLSVENDAMRAETTFHSIMTLGKILEDSSTFPAPVRGEDMPRHPVAG